MLLHRYGFKTAVAVSGNINLNLAVVCDYRLLTRAVAAVSGVVAGLGMLLITEMMIHLGVQGPFDHAFRQILDYPVLPENVFLAQTMKINLIKQLLNQQLPFCLLFFGHSCTASFNGKSLWPFTQIMLQALASFKQTQRKPKNRRKIHI